MISQSTNTKGLRVGLMLITDKLRIDKGLLVGEVSHNTSYGTLRYVNHPSASQIIKWGGGGG